jgi:hypothetical protein
MNSAVKQNEIGWRIRGRSGDREAERQDECQD